MADLRYRTFRMKVYARLCPADLSAGDREQLLQLLEALDEDGMEALFAGLPPDPRRQRALEALREARALGDRLNVMDRTLPALPHSEIAGIYERLRALGGVIDELEAQPAGGPAGR
jgi:hypothetical protein